VNHKCIRLIRIAIENVQLGQMQPGEVIEIEEENFFRDLKLTLE
jgi:23S rRNA pseudouridine2457 synthase